MDKRAMNVKTALFKITAQKGFHITFENGYTVSVQFGPGNYCDNYNSDFGERNYKLCGINGSSTVECAVWARDGEMIEYGDWGDTVSHHSTPKEVLVLLNWAAEQKEKP
jgi:hypothetical protein